MENYNEYFRAQSKFGGRWLKGCGIYTQDNEIRILFLQQNFLRYEAIIPETVGQISSFSDKAHNRIYDGDILQIDKYPFFDNEADKYNYYGIVFFEDGYFGVEAKRTAQTTVRGSSDGNCTYLQELDSNKIKIIGNIYENRNLLK